MGVAIATEGTIPEGLERRVQADAERLLQIVAGAHAELSILLCDDSTISALNREYRAKSGPTDVLSFPQSGEAFLVASDASVELLGDVVISIDTASRQAAEMGHDLATEVRILLVHGLCHLLGHDHMEPSQAAAMRRAEVELLAALGDVAVGLVQRAEA